MSAVISSVRITESANALLDQLSTKLQQPKSQVIEEALAVLQERIFWREVQVAFASGESAEMRNERKLWDVTTSDGLSRRGW